MTSNSRNVFRELTGGETMLSDEKKIVKLQISLLVWTKKKPELKLWSNRYIERTGDCNGTLAGYTLDKLQTRRQTRKQEKSYRN